MTDTTALENVTESVEESLAQITDNPSAQILQAIKIVEEHLRKKRSRIEEIQIRHEELVDEFKELDKTLKSESVEFFPKLNAVISDLDADGAIVDLLPNLPADAEADGTNGDQLARKSASDKPAKRGSLRWLKEKERSRWES